MFYVAKEPLSQCQIEISVFRQNYLYKTIEKVAAIDNAFLVFSSTLQEHHIFVILPNILLYFSVSVVRSRYHKRNLQGSEHFSLVFQKHRVGKTKMHQSNDKKKVFSAYFCLYYPEKTLPL